MRLQVYLSKAGLGSRRFCESLIASGRLAINGVAIQAQGHKVASGDHVTLDGKEVYLEVQELTDLILNKPPGYISTMFDPEGRPIAYDLVKPYTQGRVYHIGRLDQWSCGLLLFTNDGQFARRLMHPSSALSKVYKIHLDKVCPPSLAEEFCAGLMIQGVRYKALRVEPFTDGGPGLHITLTEGKNREIRRVLEHFDVRPLRLERTVYGNLSIAGLAEGACRRLLPSEKTRLLQLCDEAKTS